MKIAVIGSGAMGSGIAQVAAMAGCEVILFDSFQNSISKARDTILNSLSKLSAKGKLTDQEAKSIFGRIYFVDQLESISESQLVIEAIIEDEAEKKKLFSSIERMLPDTAIIASNTSSLSVTGLAKNLIQPDRFIGIHFFNPPVLMKLVEIIPALQTSNKVVEDITTIIQSWDKVTVLAKDTPGFIVNRIARPFYGEALRIAEEQLATPFRIDKAMKAIGGFKMGPFELMDFIGNDINEAVTRSVWTAMHFESRYKPSTMQGNMVRAGWLGRKTGKGFYKYSATGILETGEKDDENTFTSIFSDQEICDRVVIMLINEAADALYYGIANREDIDQAMTLGVNYPKGLLQWADQIGIQSCVDRMDTLHHTYKEERYRCSAGLRKMAEADQTFF